MIDFIGITFDNDWIYVKEAYDHDLKARGWVKFSRHTEEFHTNCNSTNQFKKGMFHVRRDIEKGKLGQNSNRTVCWG